MRKTRDLFKKIRDTKGTFQAKISTIKDRNGKDLRKAEEIKKRGRLYKNVLMIQITTMLWSPVKSQTAWSMKSNGP